MMESILANRAINMKSIVIDSFFEDPWKIIEFSKTLEYGGPSKTEYWRGLRTTNLKDIDLQFFTGTAQKILYSYFETQYNYGVDGNMCFHRYGESGAGGLDDAFDVHTDRNYYSAIIYLTPNVPMDNGTQLYRKVDGEYVPDVVYHNKFNRLIMFPGNIPHSAMKVNGGNDDRLTLLFFIDKLERVD